MLVSEGLLNKQIAGQLGPTEKTIKLHRAGVMRKLGVRSVAELVKLIERLRQTGRLDAINDPDKISIRNRGVVGSDRSIVRSG